MKDAEKLGQSATSNQTESTSKKVVTNPTTENEDPAFANLGASLAEIKNLKGVTGYIMRSNTSALLDLPDRDKISQYAFLSHQLHESCLEIAKQLSVSEVENVLLEGKNQKALLINIGENKICIFMEKNVDHVWVIKRILI